jgi:predicted DNA-binding transcriptional regulator AlpA
MSTQTHQLAGVSEAADVLGIVRQRVHQLLTTDQDFPKPIATLRCGPIWDTSELRTYNKKRPKTTGRPVTYDWKAIRKMSKTMSAAEIAEKVGCSRSTVYKALDVPE